MNASTSMRFCRTPTLSPLENVALDEAILHVCQERDGPSTFRIWKATNPLVILPGSRLGSEPKIIERSLRNNYPITRAVGGKNALVSGPGIFNYSFVVKSDPTSSDELLDEVNQLQRIIAQGLFPNLGIKDVIEEPEQLSIAKRLVGLANNHYYFDLLLLRGCLFVDKTTSLLEVLFGEDSGKYTTVSDHTEPRHRSLIDQSEPYTIFTPTGFHLIPDEITHRELHLMKDLCQWKYSNEKWIYNCEAPLALGKVLLEAFVAYPPTRHCTQLIDIIQRISSQLPGKVETRVWMRGKGLMSWGKGTPPGLPPSPGVMEASKKYIIPAVIIQGDIRYPIEVPSFEELKITVEETYKQLFGGQSQ